jgi:hypothetical protein
MARSPQRKEIEMEPSAAADHVEISGLLTRYAWAMDGKCSELFASIFLPDVAADYGAAGRYTDAMSMSSAFDKFHSQFGTTHHIITNANIEITEDTATCRSYYQATMSPAWTGGKPPTDVHGFSAGGYYEDELVRTDEGWRIAKRACLASWFKPEPDLRATNDEEPDVDDWGGGSYSEESTGREVAG